MIIVASLISDQVSLLTTVVMTKEDGGGIEYELVQVGTE